MRSVFFSLFLVSIVVTCCAVSAENITQTSIADSSSLPANTAKRSTVITTTNFEKLSVDEQKQLAGIFNLKPEEYRQFLHYMNNTMDGYEYDHNINPNLVLAMHTKDPAMYKHYLENVARADHDALARLLRVTVDYPKVMKQLYPDEMPMMTPAMQASMHNKLREGDVVQLFCHPHSVVCNNILSIIKGAILHSDGARLDLFFVGKVKRQDIVVFAKNNSISPESVREKRITLNFGDDAFGALEKEEGHRLPLPYLLVRRDGKSIPVDLGGQNA